MKKVFFGVEEFILINDIDVVLKKDDFEKLKKVFLSQYSYMVDDCSEEDKEKIVSRLAVGFFVARCVVKCSDVVMDDILKNGF